MHNMYKIVLNHYLLCLIKAFLSEFFYNLFVMIVKIDTSLLKKLKHFEICHLSLNCMWMFILHLYVCIYVQWLNG